MYCISGSCTNVANIDVNLFKNENNKKYNYDCKQKKKEISYKNTIKSNIKFTFTF